MPTNDPTPTPEPTEQPSVAPTPNVFGPDTTHASMVGGGSPTPTPPPNPTTPPKSGGKLLVFLVIVVLVAVVVVGYVALRPKTTSAPAAPTTTAPTTLALAAVSITSGGFVPATITVHVNQGIVWTNNDTATHEVASDPYPTDNAVAGFNDTQPLATSDTFDFIFSKAGTYTYHDNLHPTTRGTVIVKG